MQRGFLYEIGLDDARAFVDFNFSPPSLRRAIGILGFIHKRALHKCHPALPEALPFDTDLYHNRTMLSRLEEVRAFPALYDRSLWNYILIYNRLPQELVNSESVTTLQGKLTQLAKTRVERGDPNWRDTYQSDGDTVRLFHGI